MLSHRTLKMNPVIEHVLIFFAMFNASGAPASWVAYHRHHHSKTDLPEDISSPKQGGFWWAHLRWLYQSAPADATKWCPDLNRGIYKFWTMAETPVIVLSFVFGLALGWQGFFWLGAIRLVYSLHMQCFVNSLTHLGHSEEGDSSKNVWWLGPFQVGGLGRKLARQSSFERRIGPAWTCAGTSQTSDGISSTQWNAWAWRQALNGRGSVRLRPAVDRDRYRNTAG